MSSVAPSWPLLELQKRRNRLFTVLVGVVCSVPLLITLAVSFYIAAPAWSGDGWPGLLHVPRIAATARIADAGELVIAGGFAFIVVSVLLFVFRKLGFRKQLRSIDIIALSLAWTMLLFISLLVISSAGAWDPKQPSLSGRDKWVSYNEIRKRDAQLERLTPALRAYVGVQLAVLNTPRSEYRKIAIDQVKPLLERARTDPELAAAVSPTWIIPLQRLVAKYDPQMQPTAPSHWRMAMGTLLQVAAKALWVFILLLAVACLALIGLWFDIGSRIARISYLLSATPGLAERMEALSVPDLPPQKASPA